MSINFCYEQACKEAPMFSCSCSKSLHMCQNHIAMHLISSGTHIPSSLYTTVSQNEKQVVLRHLKSKDSFLKQNIIKIMNFSDKIIKLITNQTTKVYKKLKIERKTIKSLIKALETNTMVRKDILEASIKSSLQNDQIFDLNFDQFSNYINKIFHTEPSKTGFKDDKYALNFRSKFSNQIDLIDLETFNKTSISFVINDFIQYCGCCKIDENKYFVYGGYQGPEISSSAKIIDINFKTVDMLPSDTKNYLGGLCLYNQEVYCFGGYDTDPLNICKKFDLKNRVWIYIQQLPESNHRTSASTLKDKIFVAGYDSSTFFTYNILQNTFSYSKYSFTANSWKYLFENWIVVPGNALFEIDENLNIVKRQEFKDSGTNMSSSATFSKGDYLYFTFNTHKIYRINRERKTIESISFI